MLHFRRIFVSVLLVLFHGGFIFIILYSAFHEHLKSLIVLLEDYFLLSCIHVFFPVLIYLLGMPRIHRMYRASKRASAAAPDTFFILLIPAHNEARCLPGLIGSIHALDYPAQQIRTLVVADNCTDQTAAIARNLGAECLVRKSEGSSGKAGALLYASEHLQEQQLPGNTVICIIDADSSLESSYLTELNAMYRKAGAAPVIQTNRRVRNDFTSPVVILEAASEALRQIVSSGSRKLLGMDNFIYGLGCTMRAGIFFELMRQTTHSLVEDKMWKIYCSAKGIKVDYCAQATVCYESAHSNTDFQRQRKRWIAGHMEMLRRYGFRTLWQSIKRGSFSQADLAWELLQLPRSVLIIISVFLGVLSLVYLPLTFFHFYVWFGITLAFVLYGALGFALIRAKPAHYLYLFSGLKMIAGIFRTTLFNLFGRNTRKWDSARAGQQTEPVAYEKS